MTRIEQFGWREAVSPGIGRVVSAHGDYYHLVCNEAEGEILARKKKSAFKFRKLEDRNCKPETRNEELLTPITGDFVNFRYNSQGESLITEVLPRRSKFERKDPAARRKTQTLAVNFDTIFIMMSHTENFSIPRLERYLTLAEEIGEAQAVVLVTKRDLVEEEAARESFGEVERIASAANRRAISISAKTGEGLKALEEYFVPGKTVAFIGSSGVGKSTLLNVFAGEEWMATQEIQEWSGKGRHTTTSRELVMLPNGAMAIDTPGIREIGIMGEEDLMLVKGESTHRYRK